MNRLYNITLIRWQASPVSTQFQGPSIIKAIETTRRLMEDHTAADKMMWPNENTSVKAAYIFDVEAKSMVVI